MHTLVLKPCSAAPTDSTNNNLLFSCPWAPAFTRASSGLVTASGVQACPSPFQPSTALVHMLLVPSVPWVHKGVLSGSGRVGPCQGECMAAPGNMHASHRLWLSSPRPPLSNLITLLELAASSSSCVSLLRLQTAKSRLSCKGKYPPDLCAMAGAKLTPQDSMNPLTKLCPQAVAGAKLTSQDKTIPLAKLCLQAVACEVPSTQDEEAKHTWSGQWRLPPSFGRPGCQQAASYS